MLFAVAFRAFQGMDPEQLARTFAGAQERARAAGEMVTGPSYSGGAVQKAEYPTQQFGQVGIDRGGFGGPLNDRKHPQFAEARDRAKAFISQAQNSPWFIEYFGGPGAQAQDPAAPASKEQA